MAMDDAMQAVPIQWAASGLGGFAFSEGWTFLGYAYLSQLAQLPEYRSMVETIATEMTRKWIALRGVGDDDLSVEIKQLMDELERLRVQEIFRELCEGDGFFGRMNLYVDTGDTDNPEELLTPLGDGRNSISQSKMTKGKLRRLKAVEPLWSYPANYNSNNPLKPDWYQPQTWFSMATEIHTSRFIPFIGREVPDILKAAYSFGGLALTQMAKPYVDNWLRTRQSVSDLIHAFTVFVMSTNFNQLAGADGANILKRLQVFNNFRDNTGLMVVDKDTEALTNVSAPLGTLDQLQAQSQEQMAAVSKIPLVKLLGISPHGLNASSEGEIQVFYDSIHAFQAKFFTPGLRRIIGFAQLNIWGYIDPRIVFDYEPLWSLDEKGEAEVRKIDADTGKILIDGGVIDQEEERKRVANDPGTLYPGLDINKLPDLKEEEEQGLVVPGRGGAGGAGEGMNGGGENDDTDAAAA